MAFIFAAKLNQVPEGSILECLVDGRAVVLINNHGKIYCLDQMCTHEEVSLGGGFCEGNCLVCPAHGAMFDLETGAVKLGPAVVPIKTHEVKIQGEDVLVSVN